MILYFRSPFWLPGVALVVAGAVVLPLLGMRTFQAPSLGSPVPLPFAVAVPLLCAVGVLLCLVREARALPEYRARRPVGWYEASGVGVAVAACGVAWWVQSDLFPWVIAIRNLVGLIGVGLIARRVAGEVAAVSVPIVITGLSLVAGRAFPDPVLTWLTLPASSGLAGVVAAGLGFLGCAVGLGRAALHRLVRQEA